jgi:hypothetical protein
MCLCDFILDREANDYICARPLFFRAEPQPKRDFHHKKCAADCLADFFDTVIASVGSSRSTCGNRYPLERRTTPDESSQQHPAAGP